MQQEHLRKPHSQKEAGLHICVLQDRPVSELAILYITYIYIIEGLWRPRYLVPQFEGTLIEASNIRAAWPLITQSLSLNH